MKQSFKYLAVVAFICSCAINSLYSQVSTAQAPNTLNGKYSKDVSSESAIITALYEVISGESGEARDWDRFKMPSNTLKQSSSAYNLSASQ